MKIGLVPVQRTQNGPHLRWFCCNIFGRGRGELASNLREKFLNCAECPKYFNLNFLVSPQVNFLFCLSAGAAAFIWLQGHERFGIK